MSRSPAQPLTKIRLSDIYEVRLSCRPKAHRVRYGPDGVTFLDHTETELAFLLSLGDSAKCACAGVYQDVQEGYVVGPGAHMPGKPASNLFHALVQPIQLRLEVSSLHCFIACSIPDGAKPPTGHVIAYHSPPGPALAEITGKGIRINQTMVERAAAITKPGSLCAEKAHCRPCRFIARGALLIAHLQSEPHRDTVLREFYAAFPPGSLLD
jgi:hypothetical protein